ncbi:MAG: 5-formyltetrahydrofolate cyclo-ligase [Deltaproteobacteria bacterium]|nr:5-formyltetrahydrofolate cyclo-ligase [Deltaproteobacteria bacterium]
MDDTERWMRERAKVQIRKRARAVRGAMATSALSERSVRLAERLGGLPEVARAERLGVFWPIERQKEVDLRALYATLVASGKRLAFPRIDEPGAPLAFAWVPDLTALEERGRGFAEPPADASTTLDLDVVLVPALAADARGHRLGYGAGYYDRTLPLLRPPALAVTVVYDFQLAPELPDLETDVAVDLVVTEERTLDLRPGASRIDGMPNRPR